MKNTKTIDGVEITVESTVYATNNLRNYENMEIIELSGESLCNCSTAWIKCFSTKKLCQDFIDNQSPHLL
jgi:hypothetical protein